jgi:hypothetical protein
MQSMPSSNTALPPRQLLAKDYLLFLYIKLYKNARNEQNQGISEYPNKFFKKFCLLLLSAWQTMDKDLSYALAFL